MSRAASRKTKQKKKNKTLKWTIWGILIVIAAIIGYYIYSIANFASNIQPNNDSRFPPPDETEQVSAPPKWEGKERVNILLLGGDDRDGTGSSRSDTLMVVSIDPVTKKAHVLSVLRDSYVQIPGYRQNRVNAALAFGGPHLAMETVGNMLDLEIQYYVYVDFYGFMELVDAIGGVELEVERDMYYVTRAEPEFDINLKAGLQELDGKKALQYARFRHDARGDYGRAERQRKLVTTIADKLKSTTSIIRLPKILNALEPYIETNMDFSSMWKLGTLGFEIRNDKIETVQIPPPDNLVNTTLSNDAQVITFDQQRLHSFVDELLTADDEEEAGEKQESAAGDEPGEGEPVR